MEIQSGAVRPFDSISEGWELIKSDYWTFFGMSVIALIAMIFVSLILGTINNGVVYSVGRVMGTDTETANAGFSVAALVPQLAGMFTGIFTSLLSGAISGALFCGIYKGLSRKANGELANFGDLFSGFENFQACLTVAAAVAVAQFFISAVFLLVAAAFGVSAYGLGMFEGGKPNAATVGGIVGLGLLFGFAVLLFNTIVSALTAFALPLIGERNLNGVEALKLSVKAGLANLGGIIVLLIASGLLSLVGALCCLVGVLFVFPVTLAAMFIAYQNVFGRPQFVYQNAPPPPPTFDPPPNWN